MPLGWERLNTKASHPNKNIVFLKALSGPHEATSLDYLRRIAAQCLPIMNTNYLSVVSLEEYAPNLEFWGRNFNNGEVIQLVLRSPSTGAYLPFRFVQMVMMHELAHCKEMNHSKAFWKVRNGYAEEMKQLWEKGYTGDGLWGKGQLLDNGAFAEAELAEGEVLPQHMCGGTFRSKGRGKRKVKPKITYKEQKERRIRKKFGVNGQMLGADDEVKVKLEKGKKPAGKPRVAGSARGRELRAAAALARFEVKKEEEVQIKDEELVTDSEAEDEDEFEDEVRIKEEPSDAVDITGERLVDGKGNGMVKVCEDEDPDSGDAQRELQELRGIKRYTKPVQSPSTIKERGHATLDSKPKAPVVPKEVKDEPNDEIQLSAKTPNKTTTSTRAPIKPTQPPEEANSIASTAKDNVAAPRVIVAAETCQICSVENDSLSLTCIVCANVLKPDFVVGSWTCKRDACQESKYLNAGDVVICGVCGERKSL
jgi:hypothetical protein